MSISIICVNAKSIKMYNVIKILRYVTFVTCLYMFQCGGIKEIVVGLVTDDKINIIKPCYDGVHCFSYSDLISYYKNQILYKKIVKN